MSHALDPDYATIGGMLLEPAQLDRLSDWLRPEDFAKPLCGELYELLTTMRSMRSPIDPVTVLGELRRAGRLRSDGYPAGELIAMVESVPTPASTPYYARMVLEAATFRRIEQCGARITQVGHRRRGSPDDAFELLGQGWSELADVRSRWQRSGEPSQSRSSDRGRASELVETRAIDRPAATRAR
ncbi:MAG TPA: DnaB-like helicase N-terminal domain-containing protein [Mycobacteriales bacterium]|nr:DnaB-like helicase N-terminal domain-containing protein [Mycobacteriales bacterium]